MPRTKDLVLFVLVLFFLLLAIVFTLDTDQEKNRPANPLNLKITDSEFNVEVQYEEKDIDRKSIIERLRSAIASDDSVVAFVPSQNEEDTNQEETASTSAASIFSLNKCENMRNAIVFARTWPLTGTKLETVEGVRVVKHETVTEVKKTVGTTTSMVEEVNSKLLASLPFIPQPAAEVACLDSEIIGVDTNGSLLFNSDAIAYRNRAAGELLGYARDGYPIYGLYIGETDECGGYMSNDIYRYTVKSDRNYFLGCYKAAPQSFVGE